VTINYSTREEWLIAATALMRTEVFEPKEITIPAVRLSVGWPGGRADQSTTGGQCWKSAMSADKIPQVFVSPIVDDAAQVLEVLGHELIHAVDDCESGHRGAFAKMMKTVGYEGKMTGCTAGQSLKDIYALLLIELGDYPHSKLGVAGDAGQDPDGGAESPKKQGTRMLKVSCQSPDLEGEAYSVRMTRKWLDLYGAPICPCHGVEMIEG
jgi:hypothetical protein